MPDALLHMHIRQLPWAQVFRCTLANPVGCSSCWPLLLVYISLLAEPCLEHIRTCVGSFSIVIRFEYESGKPCRMLRLPIYGAFCEWIQLGNGRTWTRRLRVHVTDSNHQNISSSRSFTRHQEYVLKTAFRMSQLAVHMPCILL